MIASYKRIIIANSKNIIQIEGYTYYPPDDVNFVYLIKSKMKYLCYWKGFAHYFSINLKDTIISNVAWYYPKSTKISRLIMRIDFSNYVAFDNRIKKTNNTKVDNILQLFK